MGELVFKAGSAMKLDVIVAWDAGQEDFMSFGIDGYNHVDVASGDSGDIAISINATDVDIKRIAGDVDVRGFEIFDCSFNRDSIKGAIIFGFETVKNFGGEFDE